MLALERVEQRVEHGEVVEAQRELRGHVVAPCERVRVADVDGEERDLAAPSSRASDTNAAARGSSRAAA